MLESAYSVVRPNACLFFDDRDIMRWPWGRGSVGRAMRSQRIGQGFESPRLHQLTSSNGVADGCATPLFFCGMCF